jgi:flagellar basal-body rod protein FlgB
MILDRMFGKTTLPLLGKGLDTYNLRQKVHANNLANLSTFGFNRSEVAFEEELRAALDERKLKGYATHPAHFPIGRTDLSRVHPTPFKPDDPEIYNAVNNVDVDKEMASVAQNNIQFNLAARLFSQRDKALKDSMVGPR